MTDQPTVLVPLDGSLPSTAALPVARGLATIQHTTITVVHVADEIVPIQSLTSHLKLSADDARGLVINQRSGPAAAAIVNDATMRRTAFIVMCSLSQTWTRGRRLGSVAEAVLRGAPCPVVLVSPDRPREPWVLHRLLLPHDGTPTSALAIPATFDVAARAAAEVIVLHVASPDSERPGEPGSLGTPQYIDQPHHEWSAWESEFLDRVRGLGALSAGVNMRLALASGSTGLAVADFARHNATDLVAVAWRGSLEPDRAGTMRRIVHEANCPVMVIRV